MYTTDRLARRLTTWKAWYAIPATLTLMVSSLIPAVAGMILEPGTQRTAAVMAFLIPVQFIAFAALALGFIALFERKWPSAGDLGLTPRMSRRTFLVVALVLAGSQLVFWLLSLGTKTDGAAAKLFGEQQLDGPLAVAFATLFASVILAPVCEELLYRGAILRPIHDALVRRGRTTLIASIIAIAVSAVAFALPHLGNLTDVRMLVAYLVTGSVFGVVYVLTGSMTAAMVSHSLQSWVTYAQILYFGHGDSSVHPLLWILVLGCPVWVYLVARLLHAVFPKRDDAAAAAPASAV